VDFNLSCSPKRITDWIYENLSGRFYFGEYTSNTPGSEQIAICKRAAFEIHSEASYFALVLPDINKF
jgi:hypothetical protein